MERAQRETDPIIDLLKEKPEGLSIQEISRTLGMNRITTGKYLHILQVQGRVDVRMVGTSKVYSLSNRIPGVPFIATCPCPALLIDREGVVVGIHPSLLERLHRKHNDVIGSSLDHLPVLLPESPLLNTAIKDAQRGKKSTFQLDGTLGQAWTVDCIPAVLEDGRPGVLILLHQDSSDSPSGYQPDMLEVLSRILGEDDHQFVIRFLPDGTVTDVNGAYCRATGKFPEDLIGSPFRPIVPDGELDQFYRDLRALSPGHDVDTIEYRSVMASGEPRWTRWTVRAYFDEKGHAVRYQAIGSDITEFKHAQESYRRSYEHLEELVESRTRDLKEINRQLYKEIEERGRTERQLQLTQFAVDNAGDLILWFNREGKVIGTNRKITDILGYSQKEALNLTWQEIQGVTPDTEWQEIWNAARVTGHYHIETSLLCREGSRIPVDIIVTYLNYGRGESCCCFIRDISERIKNQEAIRNADQKVNFLNRITRVDIRNALFTLLGYLEVLRDPRGEVPGEEYIEKIIQSAEQIQSRIRFADLFQDLGSRPPEWQDFGRTFLFAVSHLSTGSLAYRQSTEGLAIFADPLLEKVIGILLSTSLSYSPGTREVISRFEVQPHGVDILIEFHGKGIPEEEKQLLFQLGEDESGNPGLFLCREILSLTGISLSETGDPESGITITMHVPEGAYRLETPLPPAA